MTELQYDVHPLGEAAEPRVQDAVDGLITEAGQSPVSDQARVAARLGTRELVTFTREDPATTLAAVGIVGEGELDLVVHPRFRGEGIGTRALSLLLERARKQELNAAVTTASLELRSWVHGDAPPSQHAARLLERAGFTPVRELLKMELDPARLPDPPAGSPDHSLALPEGFSLHGFDPERPNDAVELVAVNAAAFANHPEQGSLTLQGFEQLTHEPWFRADDLLLLRHDENGALAGFGWVKTTVEADSVETELYVLGTHPDFAGRGLGSRLMDAVLLRMAQHAPDRVSLYVEADNAPALAIYRRTGFTVAGRSQQWLCTLR